MFAVARVGFSTAFYSGVEGTQVNLIVEGDGQNVEPVTVEYNVMTGSAESMWLLLHITLLTCIVISFGVIHIYSYPVRKLSVIKPI